MAGATRYIPIKAGKEKYTDKLIPFWELNYKDHHLYGPSYFYNDYQIGTIECYWDIKEKKIYTGIVLNHYLDIFWQIGETVLVPTEKYEDREYCVDVITEVVFEKYTTEIQFGRKFEDYEKRRWPEVKPDKLYEIRKWEPTYVMKSGVKIDRSYNMKKLVERK